MRQKYGFFWNMESRRWRAFLVTLALLATVALIFVFGKTQLGLDTERELQAWLEGFAGSPWGLVVTVLIFTLASFIGAPQFVLIAACVVAFGPILGFTYSWIGTVVSAAVNFYIGRLAGARALDRFGGKTLNRLSRFVGENAFYTSFIIRNVPSAPFIVVNMAFGVSRAPFGWFLLGCALGVLPKTALVALFGGSFMTMTQNGDWRAGALLAAIGLGWLGLMMGAREIVKRRQERKAREAGESED